MQHNDALTLIRDQVTQAQVVRLSHAFDIRYDILRDLRAALVTVGADVKIVGKVRGAQFATGLTGTVKVIYDDKFAELLLDEASTKALANGKGATTHPGAAKTDRYLLTGWPLAALATTDTDERFAELLDYVFGQATEHELKELETARKKRIDKVADDIEVGATVLLANISRKYLTGLTGTVQNVNPAKKEFDLLLSADSTDRLRSHSRNNTIHIPPSEQQHMLRRVPCGCALVTSKA